MVPTGPRTLMAINDKSSALMSSADEWDDIASLVRTIIKAKEQDKRGIVSFKGKTMGPFDPI